MSGLSPPGMKGLITRVYRPWCLGLREIAVWQFVILRILASAMTFPSSHLASGAIASPEVQGQTTMGESLGCTTTEEGIPPSSLACGAGVAGAMPGAALGNPLISTDHDIVPLTSSTDQDARGARQIMEQAGRALGEDADLKPSAQFVPAHEENGIGHRTENAERRGTEVQAAGVRRYLLDTPEATVRAHPLLQSTMHACVCVHSRETFSRRVSKGAEPCFTWAAIATSSAARCPKLHFAET